MHPRLVNRVIFPLHERLKGKRTHAYLREIERTQWLAPDKALDLQFRRLQALLEFAYREVPYYSRLLDEHGLPPRRIQSLEDFGRIPYLTKDIIRSRFDELQPRTARRRVQRMSTGGSTGAPVTILVDAERSAFTDAVRLRAHRWFGVDIGVREIVLWGSPIEVTRQDWLRSLRDRLVNSRLLSAFDLGDRALADYAAILERDRPLKLYGYASALCLFADYLRRHGRRVGPGWPRAIFTTAEPLYDFQRELLRSVFGCAVAVEYGCRDGGLVANECPDGSLHVAAEGMVVESRPDRELVITNLYSQVMPIIRYRTDDIGTVEEGACRCGRGLPRLGPIEGRRTDFLVTPDGRVMHALAAIYVLRESAGVKEFQIVQERIDRLEVVVVADEGFTAATAETIRAKLLRLFGEGVAIEVVKAGAIVRPPSGKHRYVTSKVAGEYLGGVVAAP